MNFRSGLALAILCALAVIASMACGGSGDDEVQTVVLREWAVTKSLPEVDAGKVDFKVRNNGSLQHELVVIKTDLAPDDLPVDDGTSTVNIDQAGQVAAQLNDIGSGTEQTKTLNLQPGHYVLICNLPAHYGQGMRTEFTVK